MTLVTPNISGTFSNTCFTDTLPLALMGQSNYFRFTQNRPKMVQNGQIMRVLWFRSHFHPISLYLLRWYLRINCCKGTFIINDTLIDSVAFMSSS